MKQIYRDFVRLMSLIKNNPEFSFEIEQEKITIDLSYSVEEKIWVKRLMINSEVFSKSLFNPGVQELVEFCNQFIPEKFSSLINNKIQEIENHE